MRLVLITFFLIINLFSHAQYENSWRIKKTFQKTKIDTDSVLSLISFEERDLAGKLILKADFIPQENLQYLTRYSYQDTFVTKKIITEQKIIEKDTIISVDSIVREIRTDFHPIFEDSIGKDNKGRIKMSAQKLEKGNKIIFSTHYDTRYDSQLGFGEHGHKTKTKVSFYQLINENFIEYDSLERKVAEYSSIDKWEYDKVNFRKYQYDENGYLEATIFMNEDADYMESGDTLKIKNIISDTILIFPEFWNGVKGFYLMNVYSTSKKLIQSVKLPDKTCIFFDSFTIYLYDEKGRLISKQSQSDAVTKSEKTYSYLDRSSLKIIEIKTRSQYKEQLVELDSENFKYNDNNHLLIEQFNEKKGNKSNWFIYEYIFH
jgi:hypothetical protein